MFGFFVCMSRKEVGFVFGFVVFWFLSVVGSGYFRVVRMVSVFIVLCMLCICIMCVLCLMVSSVVVMLVEICFLGMFWLFMLLSDDLWD